ncbi:MAG: YeeE/YedE family protein [Chloroflexota bacterium]
MNIFLAIITGMGLGFIIERGDMCFHSTWRNLLRKPSNPDLFRAYLLLLLISIPLVQLFIFMGWIQPWIAPLAWRANLVGGLIFGVGMVVAKSCITGIFYKLGHGMLGVLVAMGTWFLGDILTYLGPLAGWRNSLNSNPIQVEGVSATVSNTLGVFAPILLILLAAGAIYYLYQSPQDDRGKLWGWLPLGIGMGLMLSIAWLVAGFAGADYSYGTSRVPTGIFEVITGRGGTVFSWIPLTLFAIVPGALIAAYTSGTLWVRGEDMRRYTELAAGGLLMGVGAGIAGGCNLGHSMVGVSLLSWGSIVTTVAIVAGVWAADRVFKIFGTT